MKTIRPLAIGNSLIEAAFPSTTTELKLLSAVISRISRTDTEFEEVSFGLCELADLIGVERSHAAEQIIPAASSLRKRDVFINENGRITETTFFTSISRDAKVTNESLLTFTFLPKLKKHLLQMKGFFTLVNLEIILSFKSVYSIRIYFLLKQYQKIGKRKMLFQELKSMLCIKDKYKLFSDFRRYVLEHTKSEFEEEIYDGKKKSDISFDFQLIRKGRSVHTILFIIIDQSKIVIARKEEMKQTTASSPDKIPDDSELFAKFVEEIKINDHHIYDLYQAQGRKHKLVTLSYQVFLQELIQNGLY